MVVFPLAIPPATITEDLFSIRYHREADISDEIVLRLIRSVIVKGSALKRLIVKVKPR